MPKGPPNFCYTTNYTATLPETYIEISW